MTHNVNVENPNVGKTTVVHRLQKITRRDEYNDGESTEATTSCTPSSPHGGYNGGNDLSLCLSLTLSIHSYTHYAHTTTKVFNNNKLFCPKSYLCTHMTFGLFTHMAPMGSLGHIYVCVPSNRSGGSPTGLRTSGSPILPIQGDLFPNM